MSMSSKSDRANLASEAKQVAHDLRTLSKLHDLASGQVEGSRKKLRKLYQALIFGTVASGRALDILGLLWQDTSHAFIHRYRQQVAALDKQIAEHAKTSKRRSGSHNGEPLPGPTARRRLIQAFRSFLSSEEQFWSGLLVRIVTELDVKQALPCIRALSITSAALPSERATVDTTPSEQLQASMANQRAILLCHRTLIYYGDLARYRELYNDNKSTTTKPQSGAPSKPESDASSQVGKNWTRAAECYHQARLLVPDNGNPSNQLAVLASYSQDTLSAVYHYYRAICVKQEFPTARSNLALTFTKHVQKYSAENTAAANQSITQVFLDEFVVLHGHIFLQHEIALINGQLERTLGFFSTCVARRFISSEQIVKVICICLAAWFDVRMLGVKGNNKEEMDKSITLKSPEQQAELETCVLKIALDFVAVLLAESTNALNAGTEDVAGSRDGLAAKIAPVLRRALPAMRIASKWLLSQTNTSFSQMSSFWQRYASLIETLSQKFPADSLPQLSVEATLEENIDMAGFLPVSRALKLAETPSMASVAVLNASHPNEEHLMRISDLLSDAELIAANPALPVTRENGRFLARALLNPVATHFTPPVRHASPPSSPYGLGEISGVYTHADDYAVEEDDQDEMPEDDIVDLAMKAASMATHDVTEDDELLFPSSSPHAAARRLPDTEPPQQTASDLLLQVLNGPIAPKQPFSSTRTSPGKSSMETPFSAIMSNNIWATAPASSELPVPTASVNAAWSSHPYGAAPLRSSSANNAQSQYPYG